MNSRRLIASTAAVAAASLVLAACGGTKSSDGTSSAAGCVDTSGDTVKLGFLNSLSGTMAISEVTVSDSLTMAADEINAEGGIAGKQIEVVQEDGASEPDVFAEKAKKLIQEDCVAAVFGGWTSSSRKAMLPVFESLDSLLFYPVQYEGLEASENIYYTGATTNQQILPGPDGRRHDPDTRFYAGVTQEPCRSFQTAVSSRAGGRTSGPTPARAARTTVGAGRSTP